jgi:exodeoxyribonuclease VII small subunit
MAELEALIQAVESNRMPLEETLNTYQRGQQLIARCNTLLRDAEQRIQQFDGAKLSDAVIPERS